ncbi:MAG: type I 3-dehydroquinate dehydratase [Candidatus Brockarchaeota archaeon]|nr:type I 3-dehydroquinate dehydratase [Candidatus Brockarchaeota archaeon]
MRPRICVSVKADSVPRVLRAIGLSKRLGASLVELRLDHAGEKQYEALLKTVESSRVGCVATIRPSWDGGAYLGDEDRRLRLFEKALEAPFRYVDVEQKSRIVDEVSRLASQKGVGLILSRHEWNGTPSVKTLGKILSTMKRRNADIYKIVTSIRSPVDEASLLFFLSSIRESRVVCFGMGEKGLATRILAPLLGSFMTYASYGEALAPGQADLRRMVSIYRRMGVW